MIRRSGVIVRSEANVQLYPVLKYCNDQHDSKAQEDSSILQEEETIMAEARFTRVIV